MASPNTTNAPHELIARNLTQPDETRSFEKGRLDFITVGGMTFARATFQPGWKWSTCVKPLANTDTCQVAHIGYHISGRLHVAMQDGTSKEIRPGDVFSVPPGHDAWVVGDEPVITVDVSGAAGWPVQK